MFLNNTPLEVIRRRYKLIIFVGILVAMLSLIVSLFFPREYRADAQVLIISKSRYGVDPYTVVKSAERIGENLVQIVKTDDFYKKVLEQPGFDLDKTKFEKLTERKKRKEWQEAVKTSVVYGTGVLNISAYHIDPAQAKEYAGATASAMASQGWQYVGGDVTIKVVNEPVVTRFPARPNLFTNMILGFLVGGLLMGFVVVKK